MTLRRLSAGLIATVLIGLVSTGLLWSAPPASAVAGGGTWIVPVPGKPVVIEPFDPPAELWLSGHRGVDLRADAGSPVLAAGEGIVTFAAMVAGRGVVTVTHGALRTTYEPVVAVMAAGTHVDPGQLIGHVGFGGHCDRRCLHWGLRRGDVYLDPLRLLNREPAVLKPVPMPAVRSGAGSDQIPAIASPWLTPAIDPGMAASIRNGSGEVGSMPDPPRVHGPVIVAAGGAIVASGSGIAGALAARKWRRRGRRVSS